MIQRELNTSYGTINDLKMKISCAAAFSEESLQSDSYVKFYTGLPSFKILKALFDFVAPPVQFLNYKADEFSRIHDCHRKTLA